MLLVPSLCSQVEGWRIPGGLQTFQLQGAKLAPLPPPTSSPSSPFVLQPAPAPGV